MPSDMPKTDIVDIHTHGIGGYDTRTAAVEHILRIAEMQGSYGITRILPTIYASTIRVMRENMTVIKDAMEKQRENLSVRAPIVNSEKDEVTPAAIIGLYLEGPFLNPVKCGAMNAITFIEPKVSAFKELIEGFEDVVKIVAVAPELDGAADLIKEISDSGIIVTMGHSDASYAEAEAGFQAGARGITHLFNAMHGLHHREPGIAGFGLLNPDVYVEVIADPFHLHPKTLELIFKTKNPEKIVIISDTVKETKSGGSPEESVMDARGKLLGGSMTITEAAGRLIGIGYDEDIVRNCISKNAVEYLSAV